MITIRIDTKAKTILVQQGGTFVRMVGYLNKEWMIGVLRSRLHDGFQMAEFNPRHSCYVLQKGETAAESDYLLALPCALKRAPITHGLVKVIPIFEETKDAAI